jgi:hypothetical protein
MWTLTRIPEFYRSYRASDVAWTADEVAASLQFPQGLLVSFLLVTPFWTMVGIFVHHLAK